MSQKHKSFFAPGSLWVQLLSRSLLILAVLLSLVGLLQYVFMREVIYRNKAAGMQGQIMAVQRDVWRQHGPGSGPGPGPASANTRPQFFIAPDISLAFFDGTGNYSVLLNGPGDISPPRLDNKEYLEVLKGKPGLTYKVATGAGGAEHLVVLQPIASGAGHVLGVAQASTLTGPLKELLVRQLSIFLLLSLIAMLFGLVGFLPIIKRTLAPLFNMVETAEQIDAGNLTRRFPTGQGQVEIDRLAESFNGMLERLETSFAAEKETQEQMRRFIADASHELRTPLTSIHGFLEVLLRGAANQPEQLDKALKSMHGESERLTKLVHDLLLLSKLDRTPHVELAEGFLDTVIRDMEPQLRILAGDRKLSLQLEPNMQCRFDTDKIKQVILNLFHNAVQYTDPEKGHIQISLSGKNNGVQLTVWDNGPGISDASLPHVFDRFYRIDTSRTRKHGGAGLGLSIAKSIVDVHGGTINVESREGEGCTFHIWLPA